MSQTNSELLSINDMSDDEKFDYIFSGGKNYNILKYVIEPSRYLQMKVVSRLPSLILFIADPCEDAQIHAVKCNGYTIEFIEDPSDVVQLEALRYTWVKELYNTILNIPKTDENYFDRELKKIKLKNGPLIDFRM